jgi:hypothetical protein
LRYYERLFRVVIKRDMQDNESKRNRALKRATDERKQREQKEEAIRGLQKQMNEKHVEEQALKGQVELNKKYQDYLDIVVQTVSKVRLITSMSPAHLMPTTLLYRTSQK